MMKPLLLVVATLASLVSFTPQLRAQPAPPDLVQQVQAADLLADLMTYTVDRADVRLQDAQAFLAKIGKEQGYEQAKQNSPAPRPLNYMLLFRGSLMFVEGDGAKFADQSVPKEPVPQLYSDLTAAQYYNMHEFLHFNQQRQSFESIKAYLQSIGAYDSFVAANGSSEQAASAGGNDTTPPTPSTPEEVAQRMEDLIQFIRNMAWKEAQAKGTSQADFDKQWPDKVKAYRESVMAKIEGSEPSEGGFGQAEVAGTPLPPTSEPAVEPGATMQPQVVTITQQPDVGDFRQLPPPVPSPYSNAQYRARDMSIWGMWDYGGRR
jgi:hypothetical protein